MLDIFEKLTMSHTPLFNESLTNEFDNALKRESLSHLQFYPNHPSNKALPSPHLTFNNIKSFEGTLYIIQNYHFDLNLKDEYGNTVFHLLAPKLETTSFYCPSKYYEIFQANKVHDKIYNLTFCALAHGLDLKIINNAGYTFIELLDEEICKASINKAVEDFNIFTEHNKLNQCLLPNKIKNKSKL